MRIVLKPHETSITLQGPSGRLEAIVSRPASSLPHRFALLCHPHPLQQGTMHNKVVTTLARTFDQLSIPSVRFNYRGVGESEGSYGDITGECDDAQAVIDHFNEASTRWWYAGFSFGSYIAAHQASRDAQALGLLSLAPPITNMPFASLSRDMPQPWLMVHGDADDVAPFESAEQYARERPDITWIPMPGVGHFFHGQLRQLQNCLVDQL